MKLLAMPDAAFLIAGASLGSLGFALIMQLGFGVPPCELCLWQRAPFALTAAVALVAVFNRPYERILLGVCAALFLANAGLALFHSGVERHWWEFHSACTGPVFPNNTRILPSGTYSVEEMRQLLLATPVVRCDEISWSLFGITMANMNIVYSLALALFSFAAAKRQDKML